MGANLQDYIQCSGLNATISKSACAANRKGSATIPPRDCCKKCEGPECKPSVDMEAHLKEVPSIARSRKGGRFKPNVALGTVDFMIRVSKED